MVFNGLLFGTLACCAKYSVVFNGLLFGTQPAVLSTVWNLFGDMETCCVKYSVVLNGLLFGIASLVVVIAAAGLLC